jgi:hypothetical protein
MVGAIIEVPQAACARFWIEFHLGKWLLPKTANHLGLIHPTIEVRAIERFGIGFASLRVRGSEFAELP